ncbi:hypothetical protein [Sulfuracidifex metallicus]|jgi:hypothetical protein|uniref:Uncharacterized protein n=1 Tax=Sulfuracidifex metallicus DSM 6482 = JCM 9184 TaxID=523847 RepID=A0A6A9QJR7_SULME|nr:hypothetical protein [Sulfuracidifex metallicus]MUN27968.1 hypothetical protein [Sulfuracidifex metallicus DSM 6482 = JCM 9184]WOE51484.1 hypothetical protein RQ359_000777 [Sulfuracidifex metallicus DSM 6482 = JCM 9184]
MECEHCKKREAITTVGGRKVCDVCARNEILKRIRRDAVSRKVFDYKDKILFAEPDFLKGESELLKAILLKSCYSCNLDPYTLEIRTSGNSITDKLWEIMRSVLMNATQRSIRKIVLPFTADFLMAYLIYSVSTGEKEYIWLLDYKNDFNGIEFIVPFFSTSWKELSGFMNSKTISGDNLMDLILNWERETLSENYELFHAYWNSANILKGDRRCKTCGAYVTHDDLCLRCSRETISRP